MEIVEIVLAVIVAVAGLVWVFGHDMPEFLRNICICGVVWVLFVVIFGAYCIKTAIKPKNEDNTDL